MYWNERLKQQTYVRISHMRMPKDQQSDASLKTLSSKPDGQRAKR